GESSIGVTIHYATAKVDEGDVVAEATIPVEECDTLASLCIKADLTGAELYHHAIRTIAGGRRQGTPQDPRQGRTYRAPSEFRVWQLERQLRKKAAGRMPALRTRASGLVRARVLLQYALVSPLLLWWRQRLQSQRRSPVCILFYHLVANRPLNHMCLPLEEFVGQMDFLRRYHPVLSLAQVAGRLGGNESDEVAVAVTFDDGYRDNVWAIEYLRYFGIPACFFVSIAHVLDGSPFEHDRRRGFDSALPLTPGDLQKLAADGLEVGSHGLHHEDFGTLDAAPRAARAGDGNRYRGRRPCGGASPSERTLTMNLRRLPQTNVAEVAGRTRQEVSKWWERMAVSGARRRPAGSALESERQLESFRAAAPGRFFAGAADDGTPALLAERRPDLLPDLIAGAERSLDGHFDLLGYRGLSFGDPVDWRFDPISRRRSPLVHWSRLDPLDSASGGDSKVVWELNRHQWLVDLGQAYRMTGDERYGEALAAYVTGWLESNPVGVGINWASSLEVALRLVAWSWALVLVRRSPALTPDLFARMRASVEDHATHVERYLSYYFSPNTHLTGEALGLFYAGTVFPELSGARRWREQGARILIEESSRQVRADGVYFEQSTCYQRYTVEIALHFLILCARNGVPVPAALAERLQAMLDFLLAVRFPRGQAPHIGDSDGGWLLPFARRAPGDLRGVFGTAAALFGRCDYAWAAGGVAPELLWLLGRSVLAAFESLRAAPPSVAPSRLFADGGYVVMRDGWGEAAHHLVFDVGPLGCSASGGHGHADLLSIQCAAFGEAFLIDPGTGTYADPAWRSFFRSSAAHST